MKVRGEVSGEIHLFFLQPLRQCVCSGYTSHTSAVSVTAHSCACSSPAAQPLRQLLLRRCHQAPQASALEKERGAWFKRARDWGLLALNFSDSKDGQPSLVQRHTEVRFCPIETGPLKIIENRGSHASRLGSCDSGRSLMSPPV